MLTKQYQREEIQSKIFRLLSPSMAGQRNDYLHGKILAPPFCSARTNLNPMTAKNHRLINKYQDYTGSASTLLARPDSLRHLAVWILKTSMKATKLTMEDHTVEAIVAVWQSVTFKIVQVVFQPENAAEVRDRGCCCGRNLIHSISDVEIFRFVPHLSGSVTAIFQIR
jgi:hypothetical protein